MTRSAYLVSLARADGVEGEMLILVPAETRSEAHRMAQTKARERDGWEHSAIVESLRCPGPPKEAAAHVQRMLKGHMSEVIEKNQQSNYNEMPPPRRAAFEPPPLFERKEPHEGHDDEHPA